MSGGAAPSSSTPPLPPWLTGETGAAQTTTNALHRLPRSLWTSPHRAGGQCAPLRPRLGGLRQHDSSRGASQLRVATDSHALQRQAEGAPSRRQCWCTVLPSRHESAASPCGSTDNTSHERRAAQPWRAAGPRRAGEAPGQGQRLDIDRPRPHVSGFEGHRPQPAANGGQKEPPPCKWATAAPDPCVGGRAPELEELVRPSAPVVATAVGAPREAVASVSSPAVCIPDGLQQHSSRSSRSSRSRSNRRRAIAGRPQSGELSTLGAV